MFKTFLRFISDVFWNMGFEHLSLRFLLASIAYDDNVTSEQTKQVALPPKVPTGQFDLKVVYDDKKYVATLAGAKTNDIVLPKTTNDVN
mgnify:CR=1 FL=1